MIVNTFLPTAIINLALFFVVSSMSLLLKVLRFILLCGQDDDERLLTNYEAPTYLRRPPSQTTTSPAVSHPCPAFANPSRSSTTPPASRSTQPPPARPPPVSYSSSASVSTSSSSPTLPSASRSTQPPSARSPLVSYSSSASANPSGSSATLPSASRSTQPPPARSPLVSYSSSASANPSRSSATIPSASRSTQPLPARSQAVGPYPSPVLPNQSKSTLPSKSSLLPGQNTRFPAVAQSSPSLANPSSTILPSRAAASPVTSTRAQLAKPPPINLVNPSGTALQQKAVNHNTHIKHSKRVLPRYEIPQRLKEMIERDIVPPVLFGPLTPSTYADYFACVLYAEDYYIEKWSNFLLSQVTLELRSKAAYQNAGGIKSGNKYHVNEKDFVAFKIDSVPERPPFLLSRDFVFVRPSVEMTEPFKGVLYRVIKGVVLVEFEDDFHAQHSSTKKYDVSFSFNRVCLKRAHHAVSAAKDPSLNNILFPKGTFTSSFSDLPTSSRILNHKGPLPYLLEGPLSTTYAENVIQLSNAGYVIQDAILQIYRTVPHCRILICAPRNRTCDALMRSLQKEIPQSKLFRANAAFRDYELVPGDIIPACLYEGECFTCPPLNELRNFKVVMSTFMSSFRLHNAGITSDHFTHIFLVDASSVTEPEAIVALVDLVCNETAVVVTGSSTDSPRLMRSDIARKHGLKSYFERLVEREPYSRRDPKFITHLQGIKLRTL